MVATLSHSHTSFVLGKYVGIVCMHVLLQLWLLHRLPPRLPTHRLIILWGVGGEPGNMASFYMCHERQYLASSGSVYKTPVLHGRYCERKSSVSLKCMWCIVEGYSRRLANTADCHVILLKRAEQKNGGWLSAVEVRRSCIVVCDLVQVLKALWRFCKIC